jgi:hypothetical protein
MAGAGHSLSAMLAFAEIYALFNSSNYDMQRDWITRGWQDATAGWWKPTGGNKKPRPFSGRAGSAKYYVP